MVRGVGDDAQLSRAQRPRFRQEVERLLLDVEHAAGDFEKVLAGLGQRHLLLVAVEEQDVVFLLQLAHLVRDRRLGEEQRLGGAREAAVDGHVMEGAKLHVAHRGGLSID